MSKKELNNPLDSPDRRFTLPKSQILSGRQNFEHLFSNSALITAPTVNLRYTVYQDPAKKTLVGFITPKRLGNAVKRIRAKRLLREAYRLNQYLISDVTENEKISVHFVLLARRVNLDFQQVQKDVISLLRQMRKQVLTNKSF